VSERAQEEWVGEAVVDHEPHVIPRGKRHLRHLLPDTHDPNSIPVIVGMKAKRAEVFLLQCNDRKT
jgi:hypothetical protein